MNFIKILHSLYILQHIEKTIWNLPHLVVLHISENKKLVDNNVKIKSRKTPQQKFIFQIGSLYPIMSTKSFIQLIYSCLSRNQVPSSREASFSCR